MWPDEIKLTKGIIYVEIDGRKIKLSQRESAQLRINIKKRGRVNMKRKFRLSAWRDKIWTVWESDTWYEGLVHFCNRNAAIMWLKRYGKPETSYMFGNQERFGASVRVVNGYVYFYDQDSGLKISAESKRTNPYAIRNN